ncbi:MAG: flagellar hook-associated protein FlgK [Bdellovibrionales bacterium]|jgi:flagellar hook-associated protein 1 FlgK
MSIAGALSVALSGMQVSSTAVQTISGNVANAQTANYTQKNISLAPVTTGSSLGGVTITGYTRVTNDVLFTTLNNATSDASYYSTQSNYLSQVQSILNSIGNPPALSGDLGDFQAAWTQYAADPSNSTLEKNVVSTGQALANTISSIAADISTLETNTKNDLSTSIYSLNSTLKTIQELNIQITSALSNNQPTVNLEDERDTAINMIASFTNVVVMQRDNGQIALYTPTGTALLDHQAQTFNVGPEGNTVVNSAGSDITDSLAGGTLQAQTDFLASTATASNGVGVIVKLKSQLQNFANMFVATTADGNSFADVYNAAATEAGEQASSFFTANVDFNGLPNLTSFSVNADLISGATTVKSAAAVDINDAFSATDIAITTTDMGGGVFTYNTSSTFSSDGLITQSQTYSGIVTAILSGFQQAANTVKAQYETAATQQEYYQSSLSSQTGVNTDTELVNLTNWENSYAACAHLISTIKEMMKILEGMVT